MYAYEDLFQEHFIIKGEWWARNLEIFNNNLILIEILKYWKTSFQIKIKFWFEFFKTENIFHGCEYEYQFKNPN